MRDIFWALAFVGLLMLMVRWVRWVYGRLFVSHQVMDYQRGLLFRRGKFVRVLEPGTYRFFLDTATVEIIDMRPRPLTITGQEIMTADNIGLRISVAALYEVVDPLAAIRSSTNYETAIYSELQIALRHVVGNYKIDDLLEQRQVVSEQMPALVEARMTAMGVRLLRVDIKDIMFPGDLKKVFNQVIKAQKEGLAALEKARGETAALRSLANAARLLADNPQLLQLRTLQALGESNGNTLVLNMSGDATSIMPRKGNDAPKIVEG